VKARDYARLVVAAILIGSDISFVPGTFGGGLMVLLGFVLIIAALFD